MSEIEEEKIKNHNETQETETAAVPEENAQEEKTQRKKRNKNNSKFTDDLLLPMSPSSADTTFEPSIDML